MLVRGVERQEIHEVNNQARGSSEAPLVKGQVRLSLIVHPGILQGNLKLQQQGGGNFVLLVPRKKKPLWLRLKRAEALVRHAIQSARMTWHLLDKVRNITLTPQILTVGRNMLDPQQDEPRREAIKGKIPDQQDLSWNRSPLIRIMNHSKMRRRDTKQRQGRGGQKDAQNLDLTAMLLMERIQLICRTVTMPRTMTMTTTKTTKHGRRREEDKQPTGRRVRDVGALEAIARGSRSRTIAKKKVRMKAERNQQNLRNDNRLVEPRTLPGAKHLEVDARHAYP
mmetsp:Transcript_12611/g.34972  ORF Transcript_12611/g.34972 Transcript_12611/m.34972 type:complete len:281 (+) Transcript_12611:5192-6034(+)